MKILVLAALFFSPHLHGQSARNLGLAIGWDHHQNAHGTAAEIQSPAFYKGEGLFYGSLITAYLQASTLTIDNWYVDDKGKYKSLEAVAYSTGLTFAFPQIKNTFMGTYTQGGVVALHPDRKLASDKSYGARLVIGFEFFTQRQEGGQSESSFYIQTIQYFGLDRADKISGEPELFNGNTLGLGVRFYL